MLTNLLVLVVGVIILRRGVASPNEDEERRFRRNDGNGTSVASLWTKCVSWLLQFQISILICRWLE